MRLAAAGLLLLAIAACKKTEPAPPLAAPAQPAPLSSAPSPLTTPTPVKGWTTGGGDFLLLGRQAPAFSAKLAAGGDFSQEKLRGRWTIMEFRDRDNLDAEEETFASALNAAADQDPDLDLLRVIVPPEVVSRMGKFRALTDKAQTIVDEKRSIAAAFGVMDLPLYLLIGPDLTIEAVRGRLADSPENGIKDVIRGVAEIRKQIADPT